MESKGSRYDHVAPDQWGRRQLVRLREHQTQALPVPLGKRSHQHQCVQKCRTTHTTGKVARRLQNQ